MFPAPPSDRRKASLQIDFLIVGASVSGLTAAIGLGRAGHRVRLLEKESRVARTGAGIRLAPNVVSSLRRWGLEEEIAQVASPVRGSRFIDMDSGAPFAFIEWADKVVKESGASWYALNYKDLIEILHRNALQAGAEVVTDASVKRVHSPQSGASLLRPSVTLDDGRTFDADVIIGADGPYSTVRGAIEEQPTVPTWSGVLCFSSLVPIEGLKQDPLLRDLSLCTPAFCGTHRGLGGYATRGDKEYSIHLFWEYPIELPDNYDPDFPASDLPPLTAPVTDLVKRLVSVQDKTDIRRWMVWPLVQTWIDESERIALLGEAACPHIPYAFHTASNPIESATVLATLFSYLRSIDQIPQFLRAYEHLRRSRAEEISTGDSQTASLWTLPPGPEKQARDEAMRHTLAQEHATWDDVECEKQWSQISHIWLYDGIDAADEWWLQWGLLREHALLAESPEAAAAAGVRFDGLRIRVDA
ncbi:FAD/NAD-P-binding domain-containing protein [Vararia minispora EC-137]|uniref:FAD/NAD-P-binding domain-containing protein n=1 Tax=Vararia minispora EC-137 TaxID=1314806 RepID=A0ACB8QI05_9AGAM|nr:FAD/NAD-P-binding domain-containing protein [Vararia minispora EC-137]